MIEIYLNQIFYILNYITNSEIDNKNHYFELFFSILSSREIVLIYYFTFYLCRKNKDRKYYDLLINSNLIANLDHLLLFHDESKIDIFEEYQ